MNKLPLSKQAQIIQLLCEGCSLRATSRISDTAFNSVKQLLIDVGTACQIFHDETVRGIRARRVQCDEIWSFVYSKQKNTPCGLQDVAGDKWVYVGIDAETKLVIDWLVGDRDAQTANAFMQGLASRLANQVQLTTDGFRPYLDAVENAFEGRIDFAQLVKIYGTSTRNGVTDNRQQYIGADKNRICGRPNPRYITTSHIERQNLTMRMHMRRFTRKTNAFSKKLENHKHSVAIHFVYYNFVRIHKTLRVTPAMEAGLSNRLWEVEDLVLLTNQLNRISN